MKKSMVCISVEDLAHVLGNDKPLRRFILEGGLAETGGNLKLAALIQERTVNNAVIPDAIEITAKSKANAEMLAVVKGTPKLYIDHLNKTLARLRVSVLRHKVQAATLMEEGGKSYALLASLWGDISDSFDRVGPSKLGSDLLAFSETYLTEALGLLKSARKFSVTLLLSDDNRQGTMAALMDLLELKSNPRPDIMKAMVAEFHKVTGRDSDVVSGSVAHRLRFLKAQRMVEEQGVSDLMAECVSWVRVQCFYYHEHMGQDRNLSVELGYLTGPDAVRRYTEFKENVKVRHTPAAPARVVTRKMKFR